MSIIVSMKSPRVPMLLSKVSLDRTIRAAVLFHLAACLLAVFGIALDNPTHGWTLYRCATIAVWTTAIEASIRVTIEFLAILRLNSTTQQTIGELPKIH